MGVGRFRAGPEPVHPPPSGKTERVSSTVGNLGVPLPISFLGDELNRVSDVNPCRKTGGGAPWGTLDGGHPSCQLAGRGGISTRLKKKISEEF